MNISFDINVRLSADDGLVRVLEALLAARTPAPLANPVTPTHLPRVDDQRKPEPTLAPHDVAGMLNPERVEPTHIPDFLRNTTLHPITQEALAALNDPMVTGRSIDAVAERDRRHIEARPVKVDEIKPDALAKPRTVKAPEPIAKPPRRAAVFAADDAPPRKTIAKGTLVRARRETVDGVEKHLQTIRCTCGTEYEREYKAGRLPRCSSCR